MLGAFIVFLSLTQARHTREHARKLPVILLLFFAFRIDLDRVYLRQECVGGRAVICLVQTFYAELIEETRTYIDLC